MLIESSVDNVADAIDGERCLGNVCRNDHLPSILGGLLEDFGLLLGRKIGVDGTNDELLDARPKPTGSLSQDFCRSLDLFLSSEREEDVDSLQKLETF